MQYRCCLLSSINEGLNVNILTSKAFYALQKSDKVTLPYLITHIENNAYFYIELDGSAELFIGRASCRIMFEAENNTSWLIIDVDKARNDFERVQCGEVCAERHRWLNDFTLSELQAIVEPHGCRSSLTALLGRQGVMSDQRTRDGQRDCKPGLSGCAISPVH